MNTKLMVLSAVLAVAAAYPRYVLVPLDQVEMAPPRVRVARQAPLPALEGVPVPAASDDRFVRQSESGYGPAQVDYGAYTGGKGAFGWYADYPVGGRR